MKIGDYVKIHTLSGQCRIAKLEKIDDICITDKGAVEKNNIIQSSPNIIDLVEYMDLLYIQDKVKLYGKNHEVRFFNPVRVDGFTEFEDGTHCIILNLDYFVDIKDLKIKGIITHEQLENIVYKVGD